MCWSFFKIRLFYAFIQKNFSLFSKRNNEKRMEGERKGNNTHTTQDCVHKRKMDNYYNSVLCHPPSFLRSHFHPPVTSYM